MKQYTYLLLNYKKFKEANVYILLFCFQYIRDGNIERLGINLLKKIRNDKILYHFNNFERPHLHSNK